MILMIDNYDSFTFNLVQYLAELGADLEVRRNDAISTSQIAELGPIGIVISPGPGRPENAGVCIDLIKELGDRQPILGVCLGHQALGVAFGGQVVRAPELMHGKTSKVFHEGQGLFHDLDSGFVATRYHSLVVERASLPETLTVTAETKDKTIMGLQHTSLPLFGVQFHPESILTDGGKQLLRNFLDICAKPSGDTT